MLPSFLCLSQESSQPKSLGGKDSLAAQTRVDWIPATSTGMRRSAFHARFPSSAEAFSANQISINRSTSTMPISEIFKCGMTGSGRKATCRKGSSSVVPSA